MHFSLHRKVTLVFLPKFILFSQERKCISKNSPLKLCNLFYYFRSNALTAYLKLLLQINCNKNELFPQKELRSAVMLKNNFLVATNVGYKIQSLIYDSKYFSLYSKSNLDCWSQIELQPGLICNCYHKVMQPIKPRPGLLSPCLWTS